MLAAHRDQENLVHSHQVPTKQAPKTPGARYPKTPLKQNDENAPTAFAGKTGLGGAQAQGKDKIMMTKGKGAATPMRTSPGLMHVHETLTWNRAPESSAAWSEDDQCKSSQHPDPWCQGHSQGTREVPA